MPRPKKNKKIKRSNGQYLRPSGYEDDRKVDTYPVFDVLGIDTNEYGEVSMDNFIYYWIFITLNILQFRTIYHFSTIYLFTQVVFLVDWGAHWENQQYEWILAQETDCPAFVARHLNNQINSLKADVANLYEAAERAGLDIEPSNMQRELIPRANTQLSSASSTNRPRTRALSSPPQIRALLPPSHQSRALPTPRNRPPFYATEQVQSNQQWTIKLPNINLTRRRNLAIELAPTNIRSTVPNTPIRVRLPPSATITRPQNLQIEPGPINTAPIRMPVPSSTNLPEMYGLELQSTSQTQITATNTQPFQPEQAPIRMPSITTITRPEPIDTVPIQMPVSSSINLPEMHGPEMPSTNTQPLFRDVPLYVQPKCGRNQKSCSFCDYVSPYTSHVKRHIDRKHHIKNLVCDKCGKPFSTNEDLKRHQENAKKCEKKSKK